jgi:hypothetical protein
MLSCWMLSLAGLFGPGLTTGDVVGALLDRGLNTISYYK